MEIIVMQVNQSVSGWRVDTQIELADQRILRINTYRPDSGALVLLSWAILMADDGNNLAPADTGHYRTDPYCRLVIRQECPRITEKVVRWQHALALNRLPAIKLDIERHHPTQEAQRARA